MRRIMIGSAMSTPINPVLCGTDFSPQCDKAVRYASQLAQQSKSTLVIVHIVSPDQCQDVCPESGSNWPLGADSRKIDPQLIDVPCKYVVRRGDPVEEIVKLARESHASQVVVGTWGHQEIHSVTMGDTARRIVDRAPCPVTVVREE